MSFTTERPRKARTLTGVTLPPGFTGIPCAHAPRADAVRAAASGADAATVFFGPLGARCDMAVVLAPDRPVRDETVLSIGGRSVRNTLACLCPIGTMVEIAGTALLVNAGQVATFWLERAPQACGAIPMWMVLGIDVAVDLGLENPGTDPGHTCLAEEGFETTGAELLEAICRHLMAGVHAWSVALPAGEPA